MRKTNNRHHVEWSDNTFWVITDEHTQEYLTFYSGDGRDEWKSILVEEGVDGGIADIEPSARFESEEDAREVAASLAGLLAEEHPDDPVNLWIRKISVETVEMVIRTDSVGVVRRPHDSAEEEDDWGSTESSAFGRSEEKEEEDDDAEWANVRSKETPRPVNLGWDEEEKLADDEEDYVDYVSDSRSEREDKKPKKAKESKKAKKSTRKS